MSLSNSNSKPNSNSTQNDSPSSIDPISILPLPLPLPPGVPGTSAFLYLPNHSSDPNLSISKSSKNQNKLSQAQLLPFQKILSNHSSIPNQNPKSKSNTNPNPKSSSSDADVLGKILGWRHSKHSLSSLSSLSSLPSLALSPSPSPSPSVSVSASTSASLSVDYNLDQLPKIFRSNNDSRLDTLSCSPSTSSNPLNLCHSPSLSRHRKILNSPPLSPTLPVSATLLPTCSQSHSHSHSHSHSQSDSLSSLCSIQAPNSDPLPFSHSLAQILSPTLPSSPSLGLVPSSNPSTQSHLNLLPFPIPSNCSSPPRISFNNPLPVNLFSSHSHTSSPLQTLHINPSNQRFSLPAMHAILNATASLSELVQQSHHPSSLRPKTMHGVASNDSIRTAIPHPIPNSNSNSNTVPAPPLPEPGANHQSVLHSPPPLPPPSPRPKRFQDPTIFDLFVDPPCRLSSNHSTAKSFLDLPFPSSPSDSSSLTSPRLDTPSIPRKTLNLSKPPALSSNDPRFVIWGQSSTLPPSRSDPKSYSTKKRSSYYYDPRSQRPASASTSNLGLDSSSARLSHIANHSSSSITSPSTTSSGRRWSRAVRPTVTSNPPNDSLANSPSLAGHASTLTSIPTPNDDRLDDGRPREHPLLMAATIERWIAELTTRIDSAGLVEFFFTYRTFMRPQDLCNLLGSRFEWSLLFRSSAYLRHHHAPPDGLLAIDGRLLLLDCDQESARRIAKVRTFVMIRHWIVEHFEDDFLADVELQCMLSNWLDGLVEKIKQIQHAIDDLERASCPSNLLAHPSASGEEDVRILKNLKRVLRERQMAHQSPHHHYRLSSQPASSPSGRPVAKRTPDLRSVFDEPSTSDASQRPARRTTRRPTASQSVSETTTTTAMTMMTSNSKTRATSLGRHKHRVSRSVHALEQVRGANVAMSDLRLSESANLPAKPSGEDGRAGRTSVPGIPGGATMVPADPARVSALEASFRLDPRRMHTHRPAVLDEAQAAAAALRYSFTRSVPSMATGPRAERTADAAPQPQPAGVPVPPTGTYVHPNQQGYVFPGHHGTFQRYFTSTMGTLGRFKRMINNRSGGTAGLTGSMGTGTGSSGVSISEESDGGDGVEVANNNEIGDLLCVKGGLERYLSFFEVKKETPTEEEEEEQEQEQEEENEILKVEQGKARIDQGLRRVPHGSGTPRSGSGSGSLLESPIVQYDEGLSSELSLSSFVSNTTCTSQSEISSDHGDQKGPVVGLGEPKQVSAEQLPQEHLLHESLSTETIKSESQIVGGLFKRQIQKRFGPMEPALPLPALGDVQEMLAGSPNMARPMSVQLDDVDGSESSEEEPGTCGTRKLRRLPGAGDLKQALALGRRSLFTLKGGLRLRASEERRLSSETSSSVGTRRVPSIAASMFRRSKLSHSRSSVPLGPAMAAHGTMTGGVVAPGASAGAAWEEARRTEGGITVVANFVADGLESDDDEPGDVEAALRRLEGVIDADRERDKARRVELQMLKSMVASRAPGLGEGAERGSLATASSARTSCDSVGQMDEEEQEDRQTCSDSAGDGESEDELDEEVLAARRGSCVRIAEGDEEGLQEQGEDEPSSSRTPTIPSIVLSDAVVPPKSEATGIPSVAPTVAEGPQQHGSRTHIRFFGSHGRASGAVVEAGGGTEESGEEGERTVRRRGQRTGSRMGRKSSLHKLFGTNAGKPGSVPTQIEGGGRMGLGRTLALPPVHRSFLLDCRTEVIAQQFWLIERDLLRNITWQDLLLSRWQEGRGGSGSGRKKWGGSGSRGSEEVVCWETFMKERAREKMRLRGMIDGNGNNGNNGICEVNGKNDSRSGWTEIIGVIMRFNLTCNWVASEIVLTLGLEERVLLLGKFIRLAFKCYRQNNFQTLTQIIHGLQTPYVTRLCKTWSKLGLWERRMFRDLKRFTSHESNFKWIRNVQDGILVSVCGSNHQEVLSGSGSGGGGVAGGVGGEVLGGGIGEGGAGGGSGGGRVSHTFSRTGSGSSSTAIGPACIPFLGLYLRDLTINDELPTYLDPSSQSSTSQSQSTSTSQSQSSKSRRMLSEAEVDPRTGLIKKLSEPDAFKGLPPIVRGDRYRICASREGSGHDDDAGGNGVGGNGDGDGEEEVGLYPLINVHKMRVYAKVVWKIVEFQRRSSLGCSTCTNHHHHHTTTTINSSSGNQINGGGGNGGNGGGGGGGGKVGVGVGNGGFEADEKWFLTCLRLKCLKADQLKWLSKTCES